MAERARDAERERRPYRGVSPAERDAARHELLLDAALEHFGTRGWQGTSVEAVCRDAGVTKRNFYEVFANREDLFVALYDRVAAGIRTSAREAAAAAPPGLESRVRAALESTLRSLAGDPRLARVVLREVHVIGGRVEERRRAALEATVEVALQIVREGAAAQTEAERVRLELRTIAMVGGMFELLVHHEACGGQGPPLDVVIDELLALFVESLT